MKRFVAYVLTVLLLVLMLPIPRTDAAMALIWPVPGHESCSQGWIPQNGHYALDIPGLGAPVVASMSGWVRSKFECSLNHYPMQDYTQLKCGCQGFGNGIIIEGVDGRYYQYAHMIHGSIPDSVSLNKYVEAGSVIGKVGNTGNSNGAHLHYAITTQRGKWNPPQVVNPENEKYIRKEATLGYPTPMDLTFTAPILFDAKWVILESFGIGESVKLAQGTGYASQLWYFEWQTDGSYIIFTCLDGSCIEVVPDKTIRIASWTGSDDQRWFVYQKNGKFLLESKSNPGYFLEVPDEEASFGTVPVIAPYHGGTSQLWAVYRGDECILHGPKISVEPGTSETPTKFTWAHSFGASHYNLKIWKNKAWEGDMFTWEYTVTPGCEVVLPAGTYEAYVDACHYFGYDMSNLVTFTVEQSACSHDYSAWETITGPACESSGSKSRTCTLCGHQETETIAPTGHDYSTWRTTVAATCESSGSRTRSCTRCGGQETESIPPTGHDWNTTVIPANCQHTQQTRSVCRDCGDEQLESEPMEYSEWVEILPDDVIQASVETMTQYRYRDRMNTWSDPVTLTLEYAWPQDTEDWQGVEQSNALYSQYNHTPVVDSETDDQKISVISDEHIGYLYSHWCRGYAYGPLNRRIESYRISDFNQYHAFFSADPGNDYDEDGAYGETAKYLRNDSCCKDTWWWRQIPIYRQTYTVQTKTQSTDGWGEWSEWFSGEVTSSETRQIQERTLYRYVTNLGEHTYTDGDKTHCSVCTHFREDDTPGISPSQTDYNRDGAVTAEDAIYLVWHNLFPGLYPVSLSGDANGDGTADMQDAAYLLWYALDLL